MAPYGHGLSRPGGAAASAPPPGSARPAPEARGVCGAPGTPGAPQTPRSAPAQWPHSAAPARAGAVRRVSGPVPLLPALTRSLRAASAFLTSPPQQDKWARSGTLRLCSASEQVTGRTTPETHWGRTRNPPGPRKHGPVPGSPPDPHSCLPKTATVPATPMTEEGAKHYGPAIFMTWESASTMYVIGT